VTPAQWQGRGVERGGNGKKEHTWGPLEKKKGGPDDSGRDRPTRKTATAHFEPKQLSGKKPSLYRTHYLSETQAFSRGVIEEGKGKRSEAETYQRKKTLYKTC